MKSKRWQKTTGIFHPQIFGWEMKRQGWLQKNWCTSPSNFSMGNEEPEMAQKILVYLTLKFLDGKSKACFLVEVEPRNFFELFLEFFRLDSRVAP